MIQPLVLDIKGNSLDDGPGIRSAVFFKGCPLNCIWCHNPESKSLKAEISYDKDSCIACSTCLPSCPKGVLDPKRSGLIDRSQCDLCFKCTEVCPAKALSKVGREMDMDELIKKLLSDKPFYDISGGGVTLSGGEATMCTEWVGMLAKKLSEEGINVLLETCGLFDYEKVSEYILPYLKNIYCDIKIFDRDMHIKYCGVPNDKILENIKRMKEDSSKYGYAFLPRTPLIPGITDTKENLEAISGFLKEIGITRTVLLPYNPTWYSKVDKIGASISDELKGKNSWQSKEQLSAAREIYLAKGIEC